MLHVPNPAPLPLVSWAAPSLRVPLSPDGSAIPHAASQLQAISGTAYENIVAETVIPRDQKLI
jgi:hypothetical protein